MELQIINEQEVLGKHFTIYGTADEPLFVAKDVAECGNRILCVRSWILSSDW